MTLFDPLIVLFCLAGFGNFKCGFGSDGGGFPFLPIGSGGIIQIQIYHQESAVSSELRFCPTVWPTVSSLASY